MNHANHSLFRPVRPSARERARRRGERGLTLIELMIAVVVGSILVGFVFDIHSRMTSAFRAQNNIGSLQQGIRAANELLARDIRQAGFMMPDGAFVSSAFPDTGTTPGLVDSSSGNNVVRGLTVFNNPDGGADTEMQPDRVHVFYADPDPTRQAVVVGAINSTSVGVNNSSIFQIDELVLFVTQDSTLHPHPLGGNLPMVTKYFTCLVKITDVLGGGFSVSGHDEIHFDSSAAPFNTATNDHCFIPNQTAIVDPATVGPDDPKTQLFRLHARSYRIDAGDPLVAPLQVSPTSGLLDDWTPMGIGFVDLQITQRFVEEVSDLADPDGDLNPRMDWYSAGGPFPVNSHLTQVGIGLVARTARDVEGVRSTTIPVLMDPAFPRNNNPLGDAGGPKSRTSPEFQGDHVYRQSSMVVDMRNMGVAF